MASQNLGTLQYQLLYCAFKCLLLYTLNGSFLFDFLFIFNTDQFCGQKVCLHLFLGYDSQVPIDSMHGLDLGSKHGSQYGANGQPRNRFHMLISTLEVSIQACHPSQDGDNPGMTQWFDTDL